jgi:hypothetical protein
MRIPLRQEIMLNNKYKSTLTSQAAHIPNASKRTIFVAGPEAIDVMSTVAIANHISLMLLHCKHTYRVIVYVYYCINTKEKKAHTYNTK